MAAQPFFKGNYGSALARVDTRPIIEAGRAQGAMFQNLGNEVAGAIKQYGLNKEKQKAADARVKSAMNGMGEFVQAGVLSPEQRTMAEEFLNNPSKSSAEKVAFIDEQEKRLFQLPKLQLMQNQNRIAGLDADLKRATQQNEITMSGLELAAKSLTNKKLELEKSLLTIKSETERDKVRGQLDLLNEQIEAQKASNEFLGKTEDDRKLQSQLKSAILVQSLTKGATEIAALEKKIETMGRLTPLEEQRLETLKSEAQRNLAEAASLDAQTDQLTNLLEPSPPTEGSMFELESIPDAAQGDLSGILKRAVNEAGDFLGFGTAFDEARDADAQVAILRSALLPAFMEGFSERGSEWAKKTVEEILPNENMGDGKFRAKLKQLPGKLRKKMEVDRKSLQMNMGTESQQLRMSRNLQEFPVLIRDLERIIAQDEANPNEGTTSNDVGYRIKGRR